MLRVRLGRPTDTSMRVVVYTTTDSAISPVSATTTQGSVAITQPVQTLSAISDPLQVGYVDVTGIPAHSSLTITVSQSGEDDQVCNTKTLPGDDSTDFSFILSTCDFGVTNYSGNAWSEIEKLIDSQNILFQIHPDDFNYVDTRINFTPPYISTGRPDITEDADDFNIAFGTWMGLFPSFFGAQQDGRQAVYRRLPVLTTGGDHYVENDYRRTTAAPENPTLYAAAKDAWNKWAAPLNPDPLAVGELWFGFECGPCKFVFSELENTCIPPPNDDPVTNPDSPCYTQTQIDDWFSYWNTNPVQFNFLCMERMTSRTQLGWRSLHPDEADGFKAAMEANDNLNGVNGNFAALTGDRHCQIGLQYDTFAEFVPSPIHGQIAVGAQVYSTNWDWSGELKHALVTRTEDGDRPAEGFVLVNVAANTSDPQLELNFYQTYTGTLQKTYGPVYLRAGSEDNQWEWPDTSDRVGRKVENSGVVGERDRFIMPGETFVPGCRDDYLGFYIFQGDRNSYISTLSAHIGAVNEVTQARVKFLLFEYDFGGTEEPTEVVAETDFYTLPLKIGSGTRSRLSLPLVGGELRLGDLYYVIGIQVEDAPVSLSDDAIGVVCKVGTVSA